MIAENYNPNDFYCQDCQADKGYCPDCYDHDLYKSPDTNIEICGAIERRETLTELMLESKYRDER